MIAKIFSVYAVAGMILGSVALGGQALALTEREAVERSAPDYPRGAERRGIEGRVVIAYSVAADGQVVNAQVVESAPEGVFDRAALAAVESWQFAPADAQTDGHSQALDFTLNR